MLANERLKELTDSSELSLKDFSARLGANYRTVQHYIAGERKIGTDFLTQLSEQMGISASWVLTGEGDQMLAPSRKKPTNAPQFIPIPKFTVSASAGNGAPAGEELIADFYAYNKKWLTKRGLNSDNLAIISVVGDSMQPKLNDGDLILVDRSQTKVIDGKSFVLRLGDDLLVKHVQRIPDNKVALISANKEYAPINIDLKTESDTFQVIGRVVASMQNW